MTNVESFHLSCSKEYLNSYCIDSKLGLLEESLDEISNKDGIYLYTTDERNEVESVKSNFPKIKFLSLDYHKFKSSLEKLMKMTKRNRILKKLNKNLDKLLVGEKQFAHLLKRQVQDDVGEVIEILKNFDHEVFRCLTTAEFVTQVKKIFSKKLKNLSLEKIENVDEDLVGKTHYPITLGKGIYLLEIDFKKIDEHEQIYLASIVFYWANRFLVLTEGAQNKQGDESLWEKVFSLLPIPMVVFTGRGETLIHNKDFVQLDLLPSQCLSLNDKDKIDVEGNHYIVDKICLDDGKQEIQDPHFLLMFRPLNLTSENNRVKKTSSEELGIISSSIAHELNNPLGGILAALSLLELDNWDDEVTQKLKEMKDSSYRCRDLVDIFLGFSKMDRINERKTTVKEVLVQALNMLRFRMIESTHRFEIKLTEDCRFNRSMNYSMGTMLFYLILGEILTIINHQALLNQEKNKNSINIEYYEEENCSILKFEENFNLKDKIENSKLIQYLLDSENLTFEFFDQKLVISDWKLT